MPASRREPASTSDSTDQILFTALNAAADVADIIHGANIGDYYRKFAEEKYLIDAEDEIEDEDRCELFHGHDKGDRCPSRATVTIEEPFTPGKFTLRVCEDCAEGQVKSGYRRVE